MNQDVFEITRDGNTLLITPRVNLAGIILDTLTSQMQRLYSAVDEDDVSQVIVDMRNTSYFGSDFIGVLLKIWRRIRSRDGGFALCNMTEGENDILSICELDKLWKIYPTLADAQAALARR